MESRGASRKASLDSNADTGNITFGARQGKAHRFSNSPCESSEVDGNEEKFETHSTCSETTDDVHVLPSPPPYLSVQPYISSFLSYRSKRHIRDSREYDVIPHATRSLLEVCDYVTLFDYSNNLFIPFVTS